MNESAKLTAASITKRIVKAGFERATGKIVGNRYVYDGFYSKQSATDTVIVYSENTYDSEKREQDFIEVQKVLESQGFYTELKRYGEYARKEVIGQINAIVVRKESYELSKLKLAVSRAEQELKTAQSRLNDYLYELKTEAV